MTMNRVDLAPEHIVQLAEKIFGTEKAALWLGRPLAELGGATPLEVAQVDPELIETILGKIAWGAAY